MRGENYHWGKNSHWEKYMEILIIDCIRQNYIQFLCKKCNEYFMRLMILDFRFLVLNDDLVLKSCCFLMQHL